MNMKGLFALAAFASVVSVSHAWTVITETFEKNTILSPDSWTGYYGGDLLNVDHTWTVVGSPRGAGQSGIDLVRDIWGGTPNSTFGEQWLDLAGTPGPGGIRISVNLLAGYTYRLSWVDFTNQGTYFVGSTPENYRVSVGSVSNSFLAGNNSAWHARSWSFVAATTGLNVLEFYTAQPNNGNTGIDNIQLEATHFPSGEPIPEPFTMALGGAALAMAVARRRRNRR